MNPTFVAEVSQALYMCRDNAVDACSPINNQTDCQNSRVCNAGDQLYHNCDWRNGQCIEIGGCPAPPSGDPWLCGAVANVGFESPNVGTAFQYEPSGTPWTFTGLAGVAGNGSDFTSATNGTNGNPNAPEGTQVGFLQNTGSFSQSVNFGSGGTFTINFQAAQRANFGSAQSFQVLVDGQVVGTFFGLSTAYTGFTTNAFTVAAGNHTITFQGLDPDGDHTAFIDQVTAAG